jgi:hypothetical protein
MVLGGGAGIFGNDLHPSLDVGFGLDASWVGEALRLRKHRFTHFVCWFRWFEVVSVVCRRVRKPMFTLKKLDSETRVWDC